MLKNCRMLIFLHCSPLGQGKSQVLDANFVVFWNFSEGLALSKLMYDPDSIFIHPVLINDE